MQVTARSQPIGSHLDRAGGTAAWDSVRRFASCCRGGSLLFAIACPARRRSRLLVRLGARCVRGGRWSARLAYEACRQSCLTSPFGVVASRSSVLCGATRLSRLRLFGAPGGVALVIQPGCQRSNTIIVAGNHGSRNRVVCPCFGALVGGIELRVLRPHCRDGFAHRFGLRFVHGITQQGSRALCSSREPAQCNTNGREDTARGQQPHKARARSGHGQPSQHRDPCRDDITHARQGCMYVRHLMSNLLGLCSH